MWWWGKVGVAYPFWLAALAIDFGPNRRTRIAVLLTPHRAASSIAFMSLKAYATFICLLPLGFGFVAAACGSDDSGDDGSSGSKGSGGSTGVGGTFGAGGGAGYWGYAGGAGEPSFCSSDSDCDDGQVCHAVLDCAVVCSFDDDVAIESDDDLVDLKDRGCNVVEGNVRISATELSSLDALAPNPIRLISGNLEISSNESLESVAGLEGLIQIQGSAIIVNNAALVDVTGLGTLEIVGVDEQEDSLVFSDNASLKNVKALKGLKTVLARVVVNANPELTTLSGLNGWGHTAGVTVTGNDSLTDWDAFSEIDTCSGAIAVANNASLETVVLRSVFSCNSIAITTNPSLESVELPDLAVVDNLTIAGNESLTSLDLGALSAADVMTIAGNPRLPQCQVDAIDEGIGACMACSGNDDSASCE